MLKSIINFVYSIGELLNYFISMKSHNYYKILSFDSIIEGMMITPRYRNALALSQGKLYAVAGWFDNRALGE